MALFNFRPTLHLFLLTLGSFIHDVSSDNAFGQLSACFTVQDIEKRLFEYELRYTYNKWLYMQYNSTRGDWLGFTEGGVSLAKWYNGDPDDAKQRLWEQMLLSYDTMQAFKDLKSQTVAPTVRLTSVKHSTPAVLLCSAYNFYPRDIELTWLKNGQEVTSDVTSTEVLSDGDLSYQIHSYLEYSPNPGEEISCMVEHVSLKEPLVQRWAEPHHSLPWQESFKIAIGTFSLVVGLTMLAVGCVKYRKRSAALRAEMQGCQMVSVEAVH